MEVKIIVGKAIINGKVEGEELTIAKDEAEYLVKHGYATFAEQEPATPKKRTTKK